MEMFIVIFVRENFVMLIQMFKAFLLLVDFAVLSFYQAGY